MSATALLLDGEIKETMKTPRQVERCFNIGWYKDVVKAVNFSLSQEGMNARPRMTPQENQELNLAYLYWKTKSLFKLGRWAPYTLCWRFIDEEYRQYMSLDFQREAHKALDDMAIFKRNNTNAYYKPKYDPAEFPDLVSAQLFYEERSAHRKCDCCVLM